MQTLSFRPIAAIAFGAVLGALSRYYFGLVIVQLLGKEFPYATLFVNMTGCFLMGLVSSLSLRRSAPIHPDLRLLLTTGFLGSYTTFSSYELETSQLLSQDVGIALLHWSGSFLIGLFSLWLGIRFNKIWGDRTTEHF